MISKEYIEVNGLKEITWMAVCDECGLYVKREWSSLSKALSVVSWKRLLRLNRWVVGKKHFCNNCRDRGFR